MNSTDVVAELGLDAPDSLLAPRRDATAPVARSHTVAAENTAAWPVSAWANWPDGRVHGMFTCQPDPAMWFVKDRLLLARAHLITGVGGSSKTRMHYHLAVDGAVLGRLPWDWQIETTGSALLFLTEDTVEDLHRTLYAMRASYSDVERKTLEQRLRIYPLAGFSARLLRVEQRQVLAETDVYHWLRAEIDKAPQPVAYVGIDPALGVTEGDELSQVHQRRLGELMDRIAIESGACVALTTHSPRALLGADELASHSSRGAGAITDAVRGEFVLRSMTLAEARKFGIDDTVERRRYVQFAATKGNSLPPDAFAPLWLRRGEAGMLAGATLERVQRGFVGNREQEALKLLQELHAVGDVPLSMWRQRCEAVGLITAAQEPARRKAMQRMCDTLKTAHLIAQGNRHGSWVPK